jgi:hypothetical protein
MDSKISKPKRRISKRAPLGDIKIISIPCPSLQADPSKYSFHGVRKIRLTSKSCSTLTRCLTKNQQQFGF